MKKKKTYEELEQELDSIKTTNILIEKSSMIRIIWKNKNKSSVEYVSENIQNIFGYSAKDFMQNRITYSQIIFPKDLHRIENEINLHNEKEFETFEHEPYRIITKSNNIKWIKDFTLIRRNKNGEIILFEGILHDITEQKQREQKLMENELRWKFAVEGNSDGLWDLNLITDEVFFSEQWKKMLGYSANDINNSLNEWEKLIYPDDKKRVLAEIAKHLNGETDFYQNEYRILCKDNTYKWILDRGKIISYTADNKPARMIGTYSDITERKKNELLFKNIIENQGEGFGIMSLDEKFLFVNSAACEIFELPTEQLLGRSLADFVDKKEWEKILKQTSNRKVNKINNYELTICLLNNKKKYLNITASPNYDINNNVKDTIGIFRDITEQKEIEIALQKSEDRLAKTLLATNDGMWDWNLITNEVYFDARYYQIAGYEADEFPHTLEEFQKRIHPEDFECVMKNVKDHLEGKISRFNVEFRFKKKSEDWLWVMGRGIIVERNENNIPTRFIGTHTDISEQKKVENALIESEERLKSLLNSMDDIVFLLDKENRFVSVNRSSSDLLIKPEMFLGKKHSEVMPKYIDDLFNNAMRNVIDGKISEYEYSLEICDEIQWFALKLSPIFKDGKFDGTVSVVRNITERKQTELSLKESEDRLAKTLLATNDGMWDWNLITNEVYFDARYYQIAGYEADEFPHTLEEFQKRIHPEDFECVMKNVKDHLEGKISRFNVEFRFKKKSEDWLWVMGRGIIVERNENNIPTRFIGTHTDITEQKKAEKALKESEETLKIMLENSGDGIAILKNERFSFVNSPLSQILDYSIEELQQINLKELLSEESYILFKQEIINHKKIKNAPFRIDVVMQKKDKSRIDIEFLIKNIHFRGENVQIVQIRDITKLKQLLVLLKRGAEQTKGLNEFIPICASCSRIRDDEKDDDQWTKPADYISQRLPEIKFSHTLCPDCAKKLYPNMTFSKKY